MYFINLLSLNIIPSSTGLKIMTMLFGMPGLEAIVPFARAHTFTTSLYKATLPTSLAMFSKLLARLPTTAACTSIRRETGSENRWGAKFRV